MLYSGKEFSDSVERAISIFDEVALSASDEVLDLMLDAFYKSTALEWHFWNDSSGIGLRIKAATSRNTPQY